MVCHSDLRELADVHADIALVVDAPDVVLDRNAPVVAAEARKRV